MELILFICLAPIFICMLAFIISGWISEFLNLKKEKSRIPIIPKPNIRPPAQKPTKIMGQNTARNFAEFYAEFYPQNNEIRIENFIKKDSIINILSDFKYNNLVYDPVFQNTKDKIAPPFIPDFQNIKNKIIAPPFKENEFLKPPPPPPPSFPIGRKILE